MGRLNRRFDAIAEELQEMRSHTFNYSRDSRLDLTIYLDKVLYALRDAQEEMRAVFGGGANSVPIGVKVVKIGVQAEPGCSNHIAIGTTKSDYGFLPSGTPIGVEADLKPDEGLDECSQGSGTSFFDTA